MNKSSATDAVPAPAVRCPDPLAPAVAVVGIGAAAIVRSAAIVVGAAAVVVRRCQGAADDGTGRESGEKPSAAPARLCLLRNRDRRNGYRRGCRESCQGPGHRRYLACGFVLLPDENT